MNHAAMREMVFALDDGQASPRERAQAESHLAGCPECRAALAGWKETAARCFPPVQPASSEAFVRGVMARIAREPARESFWARVREALTPPRLALAGAAALAASVVLWPRHPAAPAEPDAAVVHVVEMMEQPLVEDAALDARVEEYFLS